MSLETGTYISDLNTSNPTSSDAKSSGDDHLRLIKTCLKNSLPLSGAVTATHTELNYVAGVTSSIQTQINAKAPSASPTFTGTVTIPAPSGNTDAATKKYVDDVAMGAVSVIANPTVSVVAGTTQAAVANYHYVLTSTATTVTLPASPTDGDIIWVTVANGLTTNVIARNSKEINGSATDLTIDSAYATVALRYIDSTRMWRLI